MNRKKVLLNDFFQFFRIKWFCQKILGPQPVAMDTFLAALHSGEHDHRGMFGISALPEFFQENVAVHVGHLDIADDQVGKVAFEPPEGFETIVLANDIILFGEKILQEHTYAGLVIDDEDLMPHIKILNADLLFRL
jgi:hypothetical protein